MSGRDAMEDEDEQVEEVEAPLVLDALPYIDADGDRNEVDRLIAMEMKNKQEKQPGDYLAEISARSPQFSLLDSVFLKQELERVEQGKPQTPVDKSRYTITPPPKNKRNSLEAWQEAVENAAAQLEHQNLRLANLELMKKSFLFSLLNPALLFATRTHTLLDLASFLLARFGANAWKAHTLQLEVAEVDYHKRIATVQQRMDTVR